MMEKVIYSYLVIINSIGLYYFYNDKRRARTHQWRVSERKLWLVALLGGSIGSLVGMYLFRHKTKRYPFLIGMPLLLVCQIIFYLVILY